MAIYEQIKSLGLIFLRILEDGIRTYIEGGVFGFFPLRI
jgi:hypothetical protein